MMKTLPVLLLLLLLSFSIRSQEKVSPETFSQQVKSLAGVDRTELIAFAKQYLGTPYRRGGSAPKKGFDCSGFVTYVFKHFNLALPRSSREYKALGTVLKPEEFKVGDVIVFYGFRDKSHIGHVGIVCEANGMKSRFIHASSGRAHCVTVSELGSEAYHRRFYKCIDVTTL